MHARYRLVAHRLAHHVSLFAWASDGTQEVDLVNPDGVEPAYRLLVEVTERLAIAHSPSEEVTPTEYYALLRQILNRASDLDQERGEWLDLAIIGVVVALVSAFVVILLMLDRNDRGH